jgi:hypothetical protein
MPVRIRLFTPKTGRSVAQLTRQSGGLEIAGAKPAVPTIWGPQLNSPEQQTHNLRAVGASPAGPTKINEFNNFKLSRFPGSAKVHKTDVGHVGRILLPRFSTKAGANASGSFWQPSSREEIEREAGLAMQNLTGNIPRKQAA